MNEARLQQLVLELAKNFGLLAYHTYDSRRSNPGWPDLVLVGSNGVLYRELKTSKGTLSAMQVYWLGSLLDAGQDADVWRPEDWPDRIQTELRALGRVLVQAPQPSQAEIRRKLATRKK